MADVDLGKTLDHIASLEREIQRVKRDVLQVLASGHAGRGPPESLFGSVRGGDIPDELFEEARRSLFRPGADT